MKVSVFIATSLDGFIARSDGGLDWLDRANTLIPPGEDCGFRAFMDGVDAVVMGRLTLGKVVSVGWWPYGERRVIALSRTVSPGPGASEGRSFEWSNEPPRGLLQRMEADGVAHVYVDGGITIRGFLRESLVDEVTITTIPILIGEGLPLFGATGRDVLLALRSSTTYPFGFVQSTYRVERG